MESKDLAERQRAIELLAAVGDPETDQLLAQAFDEAVADVASPVLLETLEAMRQRKDSNEKIAKKVMAYERVASSDNQNPLMRYRECISGGDAARGKRLFNTHLQAQCARCHRVGKKGSTVGPNLAGVGSRRDPAFLLNSIILPSADIEPKYRSQVLRLDSGKVVQGLLIRRDPDGMDSGQCGRQGDSRAERDDRSLHGTENLYHARGGQDAYQTRDSRPRRLSANPDEVRANSDEVRANSDEVRANPCMDQTLWAGLVCIFRCG